MLCLTAAAMQGGRCRHLIRAVPCLRFILCTILISQYACLRSGVHWPIRASPLLLPCGHMFRYSHARYTPHIMHGGFDRQIAATYVSLFVLLLSCSVVFASLSIDLGGGPSATSDRAHDEAGLVLIVATELGQGNGMRRHGPVHSSSVWGKLGEERRAMVAVVSFRRVAWFGLRHRC
ncbi:hypothetical protein V8C34DRAFT_261886 [Trichoderma compactum]